MVYKRKEVFSSHTSWELEFESYRAIKVPSHQYFPPLFPRYLLLNFKGFKKHTIYL